MIQEQSAKSILYICPWYNQLQSFN